MLPEFDDPFFNMWACFWCEEAFRWSWKEEHDFTPRGVMSNLVEASEHIMNSSGLIIDTCKKLTGAASLCGSLSEWEFPMEQFTPLELVELAKDATKG